jgi:hypothetical protein
MHITNIANEMKGEYSYLHRPVIDPKSSGTNLLRSFVMFNPMYLLLNKFNHRNDSFTEL